MGDQCPKDPCTQYLGIWDLGKSNSSITVLDKYFIFGGFLAVESYAEGGGVPQINGPWLGGGGPDYKDYSMLGFLMFPLYGTYRIFLNVNFPFKGYVVRSF